MLKFFCLFILSATSTWAVYVPVTDATLKCTNLSPEIVDELRGFLNLIPTAIVDEIVAKHYLIDGSFRDALKYLRSPYFTQLMQQVEQIPEVIQILDFLHLSASVALQAVCVPVELEIASTNSIERPHLAIVLLDKTPVPLLAYNLQTFTTFVAELMQHLPRASYVQMIDEKRQKSDAFAQFYVALRSVQLRPMVEAVLKAPSLAGAIRTLNSNSVDVKSLIPMGFEVISWGPTV